MKAVIARRYGTPEVLRIEDIPLPVPGKQDIRIRVHAASVNTGDCRIRGFDCPAWAWVPMRLALGITGPRRRVQGIMFSGVVDAAGADVTRFAPGDAVFGSAGMALGAHAEYLCVPETAVLARKPERVSHAAAAAIPFGGMTALDFLRRAGIRRGMRVLIHGASGSVGTAAVSVAKHYGAEIFAVTSGGNAGIVRTLGAETVIDYTAESVTARGGFSRQKGNTFPWRDSR